MTCVVQGEKLIRPQQLCLGQNVGLGPIVQQGTEGKLNVALVT